jgi:hypothetical protein
MQDGSLDQTISKECRNAIRTNIVRGLYSMTHHANLNNLALGYDASLIAEKWEQTDCYTLETDTYWNQDGVIDMKLLWADETIQKIYQQRHHFQISESFVYYMNNIDQIAQSQYFPSDEDILRCKIPHGGIREEKIMVDDNNEITFIDIGGLRSERKSKLYYHCDLILCRVALLL